MGQIPESGGRVARAAVWGSALLLGAFLIFFLGGFGDDTVRTFVTNATYIPLSIVFTVFGLRIVIRGNMDRRSRKAWMFITGALICQLVGHTSWFVEDAWLGMAQYPAFADYWFLLYVPFMLVGLLLLAGDRRTRADRIKLALDALIVGASTLMVLWYLVLGPIFATDGASFTSMIYSAALPIGDLLIVLALSTLLLRRATAADATVRLLAGAAALFVIADVGYAFDQLHTGFSGGGWQDVLWMCGCLMLALATYRRDRQGRAGRRVESGGRRAGLNWLPYGAIALAYGLLSFLARDEGLYPLGGMIIGAVLLTSLVVARQMYALRENRDLAFTDPLTGLANRMLINERLAEVVAQPFRSGRCAAIMLIDLDRFKPINDTYGHEAGDAVLAAVGNALRAVVRSGDTAGRLGGDEFAVILESLPDRRAAEQIAQRLVEALRTPVIYGDVLLAVEASIGVTFRDEDTADGDQLLSQADAAMYAAKRSGRARHQVYTPALDTRVRDAELRRAIEDDELIVHFQPAVDLASGEVVAVEALVRWNHPERGLLMPGAFVELAEETGAVVPMGEWVLREACREAAGWRTDVPGAERLRLSVNLSPQQVMQAGLVDVIGRILDETGFPAELLVVELTEGVILEPDERVVARLESLRALGVRIAVDDFGTGYSALSYLRRLPVDILKIDRSFVAGIADDPDARTVAEAVVRLGMAFRLTVVAEGIETAEQARLLADMGCELGQGFHYYRPMDGVAIAEALVRIAGSVPSAATAGPPASPSTR